MADAGALTIGNTRRGMEITSPAPAVEKASERMFFGVCISLFVVSAGGTVLGCRSMTTMQGMPMQGGWTMSMTWMRMPGQTWTGAVFCFAGMWMVMMMAMMLPSITPMLWRFHRSLARSRGRLTTLAGCGYFLVWTLAGLAVFPAGAAIAEMEMTWTQLARAVPMLGGMIVLIAGVVQFTRIKNHHLRFCRDVHRASEVRAAHARDAWRLGVQFGLHCGISCANLTAILVVLGVMDVRVMGAVTAAVTAERLIPERMRMRELIGAFSVAVGMTMIARG